MASVSVQRSYPKCVLRTKTLTLPTQDNGRLSTPPTELCDYHDNHSQLGQIKTKVVAPQGLYRTPPGLIHPPAVRAVPGLCSCTNQDAKPPTILDAGLAWTRLCPVPGGSGVGKWQLPVGIGAGGPLNQSGGGGKFALAQSRRPALW